MTIHYWARRDGVLVIEFYGLTYKPGHIFYGDIIHLPRDAHRWRWGGTPP